MNVTLTAEGYRGIKGEVTRILENGAYVSVNRKGLDLAPRTIFFTWDAIKGGKIEMPEVPVMRQIRTHDIKPGDVFVPRNELSEGMAFFRTAEEGGEVVKVTFSPKGNSVRAFLADGRKVIMASGLLVWVR